MVKKEGPLWENSCNSEHLFLLCRDGEALVRIGDLLTAVMRTEEVSLSGVEKE